MPEKNMDQMKETQRQRYCQQIIQVMMKGIDIYTLPLHQLVGHSSRCQNTDAYQPQVHGSAGYKGYSQYNKGHKHNKTVHRIIYGIL